MRWWLVVMLSAGLVPAFGQRDTLAPIKNSLYLEALGTGGLNTPIGKVALASKPAISHEPVG